MSLSPFIMKRLEEELNIAVSKNTLDRTVAPLKKGDLFVWRGYLKGSDGAMHSFEIRIGRKFPLEPPEVEWLTPISHPNIEPPRLEGFGRVCLPWITDPRVWSPQTRINAIVDGLVYLLNNPNPCDPLMHSKCLEEAMSMVQLRMAKSETLDVGIKSQAQSLLANARNMLSRGGNKEALELIKQACLMIQRPEKARGGVSG